MRIADCGLRIDWGLAIGVLVFTGAVAASAQAPAKFDSSRDRNKPFEFVSNENPQHCDSNGKSHEPLAVKPGNNSNFHQAVEHQIDADEHMARHVKFVELTQRIGRQWVIRVSHQAIMKHEMDKLREKTRR